MAKAFSVVSWNVEHFGAKDSSTKKPSKPVKPIIQYVASQNADVVGIYEVVGSVVWDTVMTEMPDYQWHITEGPQSQEILVGAKKTLTAFFTQKLEFQAGQTTLRPGALLTVKKDDEVYPLLFLHLKSLTEPKGFGLRDDQTERAIKFQNTLDEIAGGTGKANFIFLGDLNTMGMNLTYMDKDITGTEEIERLEKRADAGKYRNMEVKDKTHDTTWWPGSKSKLQPGNLDHVVAAKHLGFKQFGGKSIDVRGWVDEPTDAKKDEWAAKYSDHSLLYFQIEKP